MAAEVKRVNYFNGQFLREPDFTDEQDYHVRHQRDHARLLHTAGIAEGLDIPDPLGGATAVTVNAGVAYDDDGQRIVLADNRTVELIDAPAGQAVYITIAYAEAETDPTDETGIPAKTRWTEAPLIETLPSPPADPGKKLVLGRIVRTGTTATSVDRTERRAAGVKGGDLAVRSLMFTSDAVAATSWVQAKLSATNQAEVGGNLRVVGNLIVTGSIQGDIAVGTVQAGDLVDNAVTNTKIADNAVSTAKIADSAVGTAKIADSAVGTTKIADSAVGSAKIAADAVTSAKIAEADGTSAQNANTGNGIKTTHLQDGAVTLAKLAPNSVDGSKIVDGTIGLADLAANSVDGTKIVDASIGLAKLAANSVDASKIVDGSIGTAELANAAVGIDKLNVGLIWNGSFTVGASATHNFSGGGTTQTPEFFLISVVPTTPNTSLKWDQQIFCTSAGTISRQITVMNQSAVTAAFNLKVYRLTLQ
jgi:hypothetical protein